MSARIRILLLVALVGVPALGSAQQSQARTVPAAGPRVDATATAVRQRTQVTATDRNAVPLAPRKNMGKPVALMIVGGAAIVVGAIIGGTAGTLFMVGGAIAGLYGLYQYLQ